MPPPNPPHTWSPCPLSRLCGPTTSANLPKPRRTIIWRRSQTNDSKQPRCSNRRSSCTNSINLAGSFNHRIFSHSDFSTNQRAISLLRSFGAPRRNHTVWTSSPSTTSQRYRDTTTHIENHSEASHTISLDALVTGGSSVLEPHVQINIRRGEQELGNSRHCLVS